MTEEKLDSVLTKSKELSEDVPLVQPPAKVRDDPALSIYVPGQVFGLVSIDSKG